VAVPVVLAVGTGLQIFGNLMANYNQAQAEARNALFYQEQAKFAQESAIRQEALAASQYTKLSGSQLSAYAKGGIDISGSVATVISETFSRKTEEIIAIRRKGEMEFKLARLRGIEAENKAQLLQDPFYNLMQAGGTALNTGMVSALTEGGE